MSTEDWIDYSINYRKYSEEYERYLEEYEKYKEHCEKYGKSKDVKEPVRPQKPEYPTECLSEGYSCDYYGNKKIRTEYLNLSGMGFVTLPDRLSPYDIDFLDISDNYELVSLKGCPPAKEIDISSGRSLHSFIGCHECTEVIHCEHSDIISFEGCPRHIKRIYCAGCEKIEYIPDYIPDKAIRGISKEKIAECKANWQAEQAAKKEKKKEVTKINTGNIDIIAAIGMIHTR